MKKLLTRICATTWVFLLSLALGSSFWIVSLPLAQAAQMTPAEMVQSKLPPRKTIATSSDAQLLAAISNAVKQWPQEAAVIVRTSAGARGALRSDILCVAIQSLREKHALRCNWVRNILQEWIEGEPNEAARLTEVAMQCASECRDVLQNVRREGEGEANFVNPPSNINPPPGSFGGGASASACLVCHNSREIQVACFDLDSYLKSHPGDTAGPCQVTPVTNQ
jgi:hypothetical protein